ncbi:MAG: hypothetical protein K5930_11475 [Treponemataceae bacterium]|nr:hypothetical protein [Treponemataceae bacterium]
MKKLTLLLSILISVSILVVSCATEETPVPVEPEPVLIPEAPVEPEPEPPVEEIPVTPPPVEEEEIPEPEPEPEPIVEEEPAVLQLVDEPEVIIIEEIPEEIQEYSRSVSNLEDGTITEEVFTNDKSEILDIIDHLDSIMKGKKYNEWLTYLTPDSKSFWSNKKNLSDLSQKMFSKYNFELKNLRDYFEYFFIPARKGRVVDEIRYETPTEVKAVQYMDKEDIIYYFFEKIDKKWLIRLDTIF